MSEAGVCTVPGCANNWTFDIPEHWCEIHWVDWFHFASEKENVPEPWWPPEDK